MMNLWAPEKENESVLFQALVLLTMAALDPFYLDLKCSIIVINLIALQWKPSKHSMFTAVSPIIPCSGCHAHRQSEDTTLILYNEIAFMPPPCYYCVWGHLHLWRHQPTWGDLRKASGCRRFIPTVIYGNIVLRTLSQKNIRRLDASMGCLITTKEKKN